MLPGRPARRRELFEPRVNTPICSVRFLRSSSRWRISMSSHRSTRALKRELKRVDRGNIDTIEDSVHLFIFMYSYCKVLHYNGTGTEENSEKLRYLGIKWSEIVDIIYVTAHYHTEDSLAAACSRVNIGAILN